MQTNPMLLNVLQSRQQQGGGGFASPFAAPQGMPTSMDQQQQMSPEMMQQQQPMQQSVPSSPFDIGISRALQSSRAALQMAPDQEGRALRKAMMGFGESIGSQPKVRGFMNNLGQSLKALGPGVVAHDEAEAAAQVENQALAEKIIAHQMAKRDYEDTVKQRAIDNEFREKQLAETKRAHDLHYKAAMGRNGEGASNSKEENKIALHEARKNIDSNNKYIDKVKPEIEQAEIKNKVMDKLAHILKEESSAGGTPLDALNRHLKKLSGKDSNLTQAAMLKKHFFKDIKGVAGNPNIKEWNDLVNTMITTDKNVDGTLAMIDFEKEQNTKKIKEFGALRKALEKTKRRSHYDSQEIRDLIDEEMGVAKPSTPSMDTAAIPVKQVKIRDRNTGEITEVDEDLIPQLNLELIEVVQ